MCPLRPIKTARIVDLLRRSAPGRAKDLDDLFRRVQPKFQLETEEEEILLKACPTTKTVTLGTKGSCRLQAHAYAAGVFLTALGTPGYLEMTPEKRGQLYDPANCLLTWAVGRDLQQWLKRIEGTERDLDGIMARAGADLPKGMLRGLSEEQRIFGNGLFRLATAFIILHELAHLDLEHTVCEGPRSMTQEREADRYAAKWLLECPGMGCTHRLECLFAIAIALIWLTVFHVYLGRSKSRTHPQSHERLIELLDDIIDKESDDERLVIWDFVARTLFVHMDNAGIPVECEPMQGCPRQRVGYLVEWLSKKEPWQ